MKELLPNVTSHKIFGQYAKAKEVERNYKEAAGAYRSAQDYDNLIRILLDYQNNPEEAVKVVKECNSVEGAKMVARSASISSGGGVGFTDAVASKLLLYLDSQVLPEVERLQLCDQVPDHVEVQRRGVPVGPVAQHHGPVRRRDIRHGRCDVR